MPGRKFVMLATVTVLCWSLALSPGCGSETLEVYPPGGPRGRADLLIITHPKLLGGVEKLASYKTESGLKTAVVTTTGIESAFPGRDLPEKIRNCAIEYRENRGTEALLLVGDPSLVPTRYVYCPHLIPDLDEMSEQEALDIEISRESDDMLEYEGYYVPTDLYYANHSDDWDINGNGLYGEVTALTGLDLNEGGFSSQVAIGRLPARNEDDLESVVGKILRYRPLELQSALFLNATRDAGDDFNGVRFCDSVISGLDGDWTVSVLSEGEPGCDHRNIVKLLDRGEYSLVASVTHGFTFGLVIDSIERLRVLNAFEEDLSTTQNVLLMCEEIENSDWYSYSLEPACLDTRMISELGNSTPFFFMGFGCYVAAFDYRPHYSIVEQFVMQDNGAIAACGLARDFQVPLVESDVLQKTGGLQFEIGDTVIKNICNLKLAFGPALGEAREAYAAGHPELMDTPEHRRVVFGMNLVGDPTLRLLK